MPRTFNDRVLDRWTWAQTFPSVVEFLQTDAADQHRDLFRMAELVEHRGCLSEANTAEVQRLQIELTARPVDDVAREEDGYQIPNGVYRATLGSEIDEWFNVHLVREGELAGQRVLKRRVEGRYKAFAYITRTGQMKLWRRFQALAGEPFVEAAQALLGSLRGRERNYIYNNRTWVDYTGSNLMHQWAFEFTPRCQHCNAQEDVPHYGYCGGEDCHRLSPSVRYRVGISTERRYARPAPRETSPSFVRRVLQGSALQEIEDDDSDDDDFDENGRYTGRRRVRQNRARVVTLPMSEITPTEVL